MISNNELTLSANNRYFLHTPVQCNDENGKRQTQSILIDNITDNSLWNMNTEKLKCSLLSSSSQQYTSVNQISADQNGSSSLSSMNTEKCRSVSVYADASKNKVISGYITLDDYKNLDPSAVLKTPGSMPLAPGATPEPTQNQVNLTPNATSVLTPGPATGASPSLTPGASPSLTPVASPGPSPKEGFSTLIDETDLLETNAFHKIKNNSIIRFYFISLFVIFIYILHRMSKKLIR